MSLRVLIVADARPAKGGLASFAETITEPGFFPSDIETELLNTTRRDVWRGGSLSPANVWRAVADFFRVLRAARKADIVHFQTALLPTLPLLRILSLNRAARMAGAATVIHVHTGLANAATDGGFRPGGIVARLLPRLRAAERILTVSEAGSRGLRGFVAPSSIERIDNAVDVGAFTPAHPASEPATVVYTGALARAKGLTDLLVAAERLRTEGLGAWRLVVVGGANQGGAEEAQIVRRAFAAVGFEDALRGEVDRREVGALLAGASIFVLPSHSEGQPISIIEAMAAGLPVVATRVGGIPDLVRDGVDGVLVDPQAPGQLAGALERLLTDATLRARLGRAAQERAREHFDLPALSERLASVYRRVASERS